MMNPEDTTRLLEKESNISTATEEAEIPRKEVVVDGRSTNSRFQIWKYIEEEELQNTAKKFIWLPLSIIAILLILALNGRPEFPPPETTVNDGENFILRGQNLIIPGKHVTNLTVPENVQIVFHIIPQIAQNIESLQSIIHITKTGEDVFLPGSRIPGIFFRPNSTRLHVRFDGVDYVNMGVMGNEVPSLELPLNSLTRVVVSVVQNNVEIFLNGTWVYTAVLPSQPLSGNGMLFLSDPFYPPANAQLTFLSISKNWVSKPIVDDKKIIKTSAYVKKSIIKISKGNLVDRVYVPEKVILTFNLTVHGSVSDWASILHLDKTGKGCCSGGDRIPGVYFDPGNTNLLVHFEGPGYSTQGIDGGETAALNVPINSMTQIMIWVDGTTLSVSFNNTLIQTKSLPSPPYDGIAGLWCGDEFSPPANATISYIKIDSPLYSAKSTSTVTSTKPTPYIGYVSPKNTYQANLLKNGTNIIPGIQRIPQNPTFEFNVKPIAANKNWVSLFRFTMKFKDNDGEGSRAPVVQFSPQDTRLWIRFDSIDGAKDIGFSGYEGKGMVLPLNQITRVKISVNGGENITAYLNDTEIATVNFTSQLILGDSFLLLGEPFYFPAHVIISYLSVRKGIADDTVIPNDSLYDNDNMLTQPTGKFIAVVRVPENIRIEFDITPWDYIEEFSGLIQISASGESNSGGGSRVPGIFFNPQSTQLNIQFDGATYFNQGFFGNETDGLELQLGVKSRVVISVIGSNVEVLVNNVTVAATKLPGPPFTGIASLFTSFPGVPAANASISHIFITSNGQYSVDGPAPHSLFFEPNQIRYYAKLYGQLANITLGRNYAIELDITPYGMDPTNSPLSSIIRFTKTDVDNAGFGSRSPAVFFIPGSTRLYIRFDGTSFSDDGISGYESDGLSLPLFWQSRVRIAVAGVSVKISVNETVVVAIELKDLPIVGNMKVWAGDAFYPNANMILDRVVVSNT